MRLNCPNCATGYEVPDGMIPTGGRHVQCTDCHTRWFVKGNARPMLSEDQIINRLEARSTRPRPVAVPDPVSASPAPSLAADRAEFVWEDAEEVAARQSEPAAAPAAAKVAEPPPRTAAPAPQARPMESVAEAPKPPTPSAAAPTEAPQKRPPAPEAKAMPPQPRPPEPSPPTKPAPHRAAETRPRIDLTGETAAAAPVPARSRFVHGLAVPLVLLALALAVYGAHDAIGAGLPGAAPALDAYAGAIDAFRADIAARLGGTDDG
jgi:predicted Zn finger-like uncharacterized protein